MDKARVLAELLDTLNMELRGAIAASEDAAEYAKDKEARAESQWDTQGLEASYLAAGQASQARQWAQSIETLEKHRNELLSPKSEAGIGALVIFDLDGSNEHFFLAPAAGGQIISLDGTEITVVTPQSPIATRILGKGKGHGFKLANGAPGSIIDIK